MKYNIRQAVPADAFEIAKLLVLAMDDLAAKFAGVNDPDDAISLFERFVEMIGNQYSFENVLVYEEENTGVCGMVNAYDGANLEQLRKPFLNAIGANVNLATIEDETQKGEYYLDSLGVSPNHQGKGIGKKLISAIIDKANAEGHFTVGLLVNQDNPKAEKLYLNLGFKIMNEKQFMGGNYFHMQHHKIDSAQI